MAYQLTEADKRWNRFVRLACKDWMTAELNAVQRAAFLCFWYDAEVNNGGHGQYFDIFPELDPDEVAAALATVAGEIAAANFSRAVLEGEMDDYALADDVFYALEPSFGDRLMAYVEANRESIFTVADD